MKYREYLTTAQRHLKSCQAFFDGVDWDNCECKEDVLKDLYYLTGYILEALTVYAVYSRGGFAKDDITELDIEFSKKTHLDYYKVISVSENGKYVYKSARRIPKKDGNEQLINDINELNKLISELKHKEYKFNKFKKNGDNKKFFFYIESHHFYEIIANILQNSEIDLIQASEDIPLFNPSIQNERDNIDQDKKVDLLIRSWNSSLRYSDTNCNTWGTIKEALQKETLNKLIHLCEQTLAALNRV